MSADWTLPDAQTPLGRRAERALADPLWVRIGLIGPAHQDFLIGLQRLGQSPRAMMRDGGFEQPQGTGVARRGRS